MIKKLRILHLEDVSSDAELVNFALKRGKLDFERLLVDTREKFINALANFTPDVILSDHSLPSFNSHEALELYHESGLNVPFILITATISEDYAVDIIKKGADDYILKDRLERLPSALANALEKYRLAREHQKDQDKLIKNATHFRALIENCYDAITLISEQGDWSYLSPSVERLTGYHYKNLIGKKAVNFIHAGDLEEFNELFGNLRLFPGVPLPNRLRIKHKNGSYISTEGTITNLLHDPSVKAIIMNYSDISERLKIEEEKKALEDLLEKASNLAQIGGFEVDLIDERVYWSKITRKILEVSEEFSPNLLTAINFYKVGENRKALINGLHGAIEKGDDFDLELLVITAKGNERWVKAIGEPEFLDGKCIKIRGSFQNIDSRKRTEIEVVQRNKELEQFSYIVSHNLRAPVANILGLTKELSQFNSIPKEITALNNYLVASVTQLDSVIKDLNHVLQIKKEINEKKEKLTLSHLILDVKSSILGAYPNIDTYFKLDFDLKDEIYSLKSYLHSIFYNLISNSIKYRKSEGPLNIEISSRIVDEGFTLTFKDNGIGMDLLKHKNHIFQLYKRFHSHVEGKGMGLFMVKTQIEALGGSISVDSAVDIGTTFKITFRNL